jgi:hypothetical protein
LLVKNPIAPYLRQKESLLKYLKKTQRKSRQPMVETSFHIPGIYPEIIYEKLRFVMIT